MSSVLRTLRFVVLWNHVGKHVCPYLTRTWMTRPQEPWTAVPPLSSVLLMASTEMTLMHPATSRCMLTSLERRALCLQPCTCNHAKTVPRLHWGSSRSPKKFIACKFWHTCFDPIYLNESSLGRFSRLVCRNSYFLMSLFQQRIRNNRPQCN